MRKHRHLPFVAMFCLLLSGFCSVHAQQQAGKTGPLYLTLPLYKCATCSHRCICTVCFLKCMSIVCCVLPSAPQFLLGWGSFWTQTLADMRAMPSWACRWPVACHWGCSAGDGGAGRAPRVAPSGFSPGQSCFALLACVGGHFAVRQMLPRTCRKAVCFFLKGGAGVFGTVGGVTGRGGGC